jgi:hypothetical protein
MASTAERRCVGVYSSSFEMRSIALGSAFRNTCRGQPELNVASHFTGVFSYLVEWVRLNLREFVLHVIRVHGTDLVARGCAENFDDLDKLIDTRFAGEQRLPEHELGHYATG